MVARKWRRLVLVCTALSVFSLSICVALYTLSASKAISFFYSPTEMRDRAILPGERFRLGGLVEIGSVDRSAEETVRFVITDGTMSVIVLYTGTLPDMFSEGQGVIAEGSLRDDGLFYAERVMAKHDEFYMPPEVARMLDKAHESKVSENE